MPDSIYTQKLQEIFKNTSPTIYRIKQLENSLYEWILTQYPEHENLSAKVHCIIYEKETGFCHCGKRKRFVKPYIGFKQYCSTKCSANSEDVRKKFKQTSLKNMELKILFNQKKYKKRKKGQI